MISRDAAVSDMRNLVQAGFTVSERNPVAASLIEEIGKTLTDLELLKAGKITPDELYTRRYSALEDVLIETTNVILNK